MSFTTKCRRQSRSDWMEKWRWLHKAHMWWSTTSIRTAQLRLGLCACGTAKAAAIGFIRNLSADVGPHGVTANALSLCAMNN